MGRRLAGPGAAALLLLALAAGGCRTTGTDAGVVHVVRPGETVWRIANHYGVSVSEVVDANRIRDVRDVPTGTRLWIPGGRPGSGVPLREPRAGAGPPPAAGAPTLRFDWPLRGRVTSGFGPRGRRRHDGIDIAAPRGTPIRAAESGRVIYAGRLGSYGNVVVLRHDERHETVYAHARRLHVRPRRFVDRGDVIAEVGSTGNATGPHLHFEVRRDDLPEDPLRYLP
ncbi:MAG: LysM peptidoglycan-binding domain-containing M23 family metallopeptidase [Myxococcota bacterium]|nr:LysM peptidoglycan-binding domain-containing M23 family metallopeptidase [Myxococcota bacterium]